MNARVVFCLTLALALVASDSVDAHRGFIEGGSDGVLPIINDLGRRLSQAATKDGDKAGPPPVKCTYAKGPLGINMVCN
ncbi:hypothetical protein WJX75_008424 [Coccomyxa subellipsoidea]|uniref:Uncharacterized protein n=1 Tax=Coccomyxa subellipsoidea TaxID=248742 RepID=A0ABR2YSF8_9CHLO